MEGILVEAQEKNQGPMKRQTAFLCTAEQLISGEYVKTDGWDPSYIESSVGALSRVRIAGIVVETGQRVVIDDGTSSLSIRSFDKPLPMLPVGTPVLVIGRPRLFDGSLYILVETCKSLGSPAWLEYYKKTLTTWQSFIPPNPKREASVSQVELSQEMSTPMANQGVSAPVQSEVSASAEESFIPPSTSTSISPAMELIGIIRDLDAGDGAAVDEVLSKASFDNPDEKLQFLISEGEVFELRAGKVKVLE